MIALAPDPIDPASLLADFTRTAGGAGAIVSFSGLVRAEGGVTELWLDHHERLTLAAVEKLAAAALGRFALVDLAIVHRVGAVAAGEPIVFVAAAASHRRAAFEAVDYLTDHLKSAAWLWKRERTAAGWRWIEPRAEDHADKARWSD